VIGFLELGTVPISPKALEKSGWLCVFAEFVSFLKQLPKMARERIDPGVSRRYPPMCSIVPASMIEDNFASWEGGSILKLGEVTGFRKLAGNNRDRSVDSGIWRHSVWIVDT
jgi:hypothetical protein